MNLPPIARIGIGAAGAFAIYKFTPILDILIVLFWLFIGVAFLAFVAEAIGGTIGLFTGGHEISQSIERFGHESMERYKNWKQSMVDRIQAASDEVAVEEADTPTSV